MKLLRNIGLCVFILGMAIFSASLVLGEYQFSDASFQNVVEKKEGELTQGGKLVLTNMLLEVEKQGLLEKVYTSQFAFKNDLVEVLKKGNQRTINYYAEIDGVSSSSQQMVLEAFSAHEEVAYDQSLLESIELSENEFKIIVDNTSWMYTPGKSYASIDDLKAQWSNKINEVNRNLCSAYILWDNDKYKHFEIVKSSIKGSLPENRGLFFILTFGLGIIGALMYIIPGLKLNGGAAMNNTGVYHSAATNRGWIGIVSFSYLTVLYILLYFFPFSIVPWTTIVDPIKQVFMPEQGASQWFLYGFLYCVVMLVMGIRMLIKYRHNKYQIVRTISVLFFQVIFSFLLVEILPMFGLVGVDLKNAMPLDYDFLFDWNVKSLLDNGRFGMFVFVWGFVLTLVVVPTLVYFYGKRWYCSWVCGCGGLAETLGDPYRQLSDKSLVSWKIERWLIHSVLIFSVVLTAFVGYHSYNEVNNPGVGGNDILFGISAYNVRDWYGFLIGSIFAGVIGTGFYPILGNRAWCRFGCPLAAYMGIVQRFKSKFRITTNGGQCISCGNCSTYCEQGIDVRSYAQKGQNIVRSSCVGCGICSEVCPRGVLKLENAPNTDQSRVDAPEVILGNKGLLDLID